MPILSDFLRAVTTKIESLTTDSYNLNWGNTNRLDLAHVDWVKYDASAVIEPTEGDNTDPIDGPHANAYGETTSFRIRVRVPNETESNNANYDVVFRFFAALDDLKQAFADQDISDRYLRFLRWEIDYKENGDVFIPHELLTYWNMDWTQDRDDPETAGDA